MGALMLRATARLDKYHYAVSVPESVENRSFCIKTSDYNVPRFGVDAHPRTQTLPLTHTHTLTYSLSLTHSLSLTQTHTHTYTHTLTHSSHNIKYQSLLI